MKHVFELRLVMSCFFIGQKVGFDMIDSFSVHISVSIIAIPK